jgi:phosphatidylserine/phosphatidylglycerophosphate/cardiolipin synthase-like enzyme
MTNENNIQAEAVAETKCCFFPRRQKHIDDDDGSTQEAEDRSAEHLSYVGMAAYKALRRKHFRHHHTMWNVTSGVVVGNVHATPRGTWEKEASFDHPERHDEFLPETIGEILSRTRKWCDFLSLDPPDGLFLEHIKKALKILANRAKDYPKSEPIIVRMMFGNVLGMPVDCNAVIKVFTSELPMDANIRLWVGSWRKGSSWNHSKIIAVDGQYLHTGGHNLRDAHYLQIDPVHDISLEMEGRVAHDGHIFANRQWAFIDKSQSTYCGQCINRLPDDLPLLKKVRVTVSEFPEGVASEFPPVYYRKLFPIREPLEHEVPVITVGRQGKLNKFLRPADDAFVGMIESAKEVVHLALQDLGPVCWPRSKIPLPGTVWPKKYLRALGKVIWEKGVDVEIALSNPMSFPGGVDDPGAFYGNGWSCDDSASEIIKTIRTAYPKAKDSELRAKIVENLRICFIKEKRGEQFYRTYPDGQGMGMHAKHFIIDDRCCYIGSQNLYACDLAEWGVIIDDKDQVQQIMDQFWNPLWKTSFQNNDVNVEHVMDGLDIDREGERKVLPGKKSRKELREAEKWQAGAGRGGLEIDWKQLEESKQQSRGKMKLKKQIAENTHISD